MSKAKPSSLSSALVTKGAAKPVVDIEQRTAATPDTAVTELPKAETISRVTPDALIPAKSEASPKKAVSDASIARQAITAGPTKSMTVKIDEATYKKLKLYGVETGKSSQDIFVEALAGYFKTHQIR